MNTVPKKPADVLNLNLTQASSGLRRLHVTMTWAFNPHGGKPMDVDFGCFILDRHNMTREDEDFVFYNNPQGAALAVKLLAGAEVGDDSSPASVNTSTLMVDLDNLPFDIWRVVFVLSVYQGVENDQTFDVLREAVFRIDNADSGAEIARFTFSGHKMGEATAIRVAEISRDGVEWHYNALKEPIKEGLASLAKGYGMLVSSTT